MSEGPKKNEVVIAKDTKGPVSLDFRDNAQWNLHVGDKHVHIHPQMTDGFSDQATTSATKATGEEVYAAKLCQVVNESTMYKTKINVVENFPKDDRVHEPAIEVNPQMRKVKNYYRGGFAEYEDVAVWTDKKKFRRRRKRILKNQMRKEIGFHCQEQNEGDEPITVEQLMESVTQKVGPIPDKATPVTAIVASAGSGKTTLMKRMARKCVKMCSARPKQDDEETPVVQDEIHHKMIHFMEAKNIKYKDITDVSSFLFGGMFRNKADERRAYEWLIDHQSEAILFIDGLDQAGWISTSAQREFAPFDECDSAEIMYNLLSRKLLPQLKIVVASREFKMSGLPAYARPDEIVTLVGLEKKDAEQLFVSLTGEKGEEMWGKIENTAQRLLSIISVPVFLVLTAVVIAIDTERPPPLTATELYNRIFENLSQVENTREQIMNVMEKVKKLAHQGMMEGRVVFYEKDLKTFGLSIDDVRDLMIKVPDNNLLSRRLFEGDFIFFFSHQSLQEFLSASYIAEMKYNEFSHFNAKHLHDWRWSIVRTFVSGIIYGDSLPALHQASDLEKKRKIFGDFFRKSMFKSDVDGSIGALYESNDDNLIQSLPRLPSTRRFGPDEAYMYSSLLARRGYEKKVNLSGCGLTDELLEIMVGNLKDRKIKVGCLMLWDNPFTPKGLNSLLANMKADPIQLDRSHLLGFRYEDLDWDNIQQTYWFGGQGIKMVNETKTIRFDGSKINGYFDRSPRVSDTDQRLFLRDESEGLSVVFEMVKFFQQKFFETTIEYQIYVTSAILDDMIALETNVKIPRMFLDCRGSRQQTIVEVLTIKRYVAIFQVSYLDIVVDDETSLPSSDFLAEIKSHIDINVEIHWYLHFRDMDDVDDIIEIFQQNQVENLRLSIQTYLSRPLNGVRPIIENCRIKKLTMVYRDERDKSEMKHKKVVQLAKEYSIEVESVIRTNDTEPWAIVHDD